MPRLGGLSNVIVEVVSKPRPDFQSLEYAASGRPKAPAIVIDEKVVVEGGDIEDDRLFEFLAR